MVGKAAAPHCLAWCIRSLAEGFGKRASPRIPGTIRYSLTHQHAGDWQNNAAGIRWASALDVGIASLRPLTSGVFQRLMAETFPELDMLDVGRLLLNYVLSDPYVDVALVGMRDPRYAEIDNAISDDTASRIDLAALHDRYVR